MQRDARSCRRPATVLSPRWRGLPPTSLRSRVAGQCSVRRVPLRHCTGSGVRRRYLECRRGCRSLSTRVPGCSARPAAGLHGQVCSSDGLCDLSRMAALRTRRCHTGVDRRRAARIRHHDAARSRGSGNRSAGQTSSDGPAVRSPMHLSLSVPSLVHRLRYRRHILDGDCCAASTPQALHACRNCGRDVDGFDRTRGRCPHSRRLAISDPRSADGRAHAVPLCRRTDGYDRMPAQGPISPLVSRKYSHAPRPASSRRARRARSSAGHPRWM